MSFSQEIVVNHNDIDPISLEKINELLEELNSPKSISDTLVDNLNKKGYSL